MTDPSEIVDVDGIRGVEEPVEPSEMNVSVPAQPVSAAASNAPPATALMVGKGLDIGTANLLAAVRDGDGGITVRCERNAFLDIQGDVHSRSMLTRLNVPYVVHEDSFLVIGGAAFDLANVFSRPTRRPMMDGLISPQESDALPMIQLIIKSVLGEPAVANEPVYFSVPAESIDKDNNIVYHQGLFDGMLRKLGYQAHAMNEGHAVTFAELAADDFTGIGISFGGGMVNVCVSYKTIPALTFSVARGGDWIDSNAATVLGLPSSKATYIKESGMDIREPQNREEEAIAIYFRNLISYTLENISNRFQMGKDMPSFADPVEIVCAGGTSMIKGFIEVFRQEFEKIKFPIPVRNIRLAEEPLHSVSKGCLVAAISSMDE
jgi:hypothetical protein